MRSIASLIVLAACSSTAPHSAKSKAATPTEPVALAQTGSIKVAPPTEPLALAETGTIIEPQSGHLYGMNADGQVEAVRLDDGKTKWVSPVSALPLYVEDGFLVVQQEAKIEPGETPRLRFSVLDRETGNEVCELAPAVPDLLHGGLADCERARLRVRDFQIGGERFVSYHSMVGIFIETGEGFIPPPPACAVTHSKQQEQRGYLRLDIGQCSTERVLAKDLPPITQAPPQHSMFRLSNPPFAVEGESEGRISEGGPLVVGDRLVAYEERRVGETYRYTLRQWQKESHERLPNIPLTQSYPHRASMVSSDLAGQYLALTVWSAEENPTNTELFRLYDGKPAGLIPQPRRAPSQPVTPNCGHQFVIIGDSMVAPGLHEVCFHNIKTGKLSRAWKNGMKRLFRQ